MAINADNAFDIGVDGFVIRDDDGLVTGYFTSGSGSPVGVAAPLNTWYFRTDDNSLWYKYSGNNDAWRQIRADDVTYDNAVVLANSVDLTGVTNIKGALDVLANRHYGKDPGFGQGDGPFTTTSGTFVTAFSIPLTVSADPFGTYRLGWNSLEVTSKSNTTGEIRLVVDPGLPTEVVVKTGIVTYIASKFSGFYSGAIALGAHTVELQIRRAAGNGTVSVSDFSLEGWRVL